MQRNYDTMSNMKDYMMWLDDRGIASWCNAIAELIIPEGVNIYTTELVDEYKSDKDWHHVETDEDDYIIEEDDEPIIDDGDLDDCAWTPQDQWLNSDGGLTSDAYNFLHTLDSQGELV